MFIKKQFHVIALITLFVFISFTLTYEYSFAQDESPLIKAQDLYYKGNFIEAIKVLNTFISKNQNNQAENKRLAEAYYLLARINYDSGEDARTDDFLKRALEANGQIGKRETDREFKTRFDQVKKEWLKTKPVDNEIVPKVIPESEKVEEVQPEAKEKEGPVQQLKKKKKFPWLLTALGVGVIAGLVLLLNKKKNSEPTSEDISVNFKIIGNIFGYPDTYHLVAATFKIYIDDSYIMDLTTDGNSGINVSFTKTLLKGIHKITFSLVSAARTKIAPSFYIEYKTSSPYYIYPPVVAINYQYNFITIGDSFDTSFELKDL